MDCPWIRDRVLIQFSYSLQKSPRSLRQFLAAIQFIGLFSLFVGTGTCTGKTVPVEVSRAEMIQVVEELPLSAAVIPRRLSSLSAKVDGLIYEVSVEEGQFVQRGQVLARLDRELAELNLNRAKASVEEMEAQVAEARRQRNEAENLVAKRHISETSYKALIAEVAIKSAVLKQRRAEFQLQQEVVQRHSINAPFSGVIGKKRVEIGQWVDQGDAVFDLVEIDLIRVRVDVPQRYFNRVKLKTPVSVSFDAVPDVSIKAFVQAKVSVGNSTARTFPVHIDLANPGRQVAPGMSGRVVLLLANESPETAIGVPRDAVVKTPNGVEMLWKVKRSGKNYIVAPVTIQSGAEYDGQVRVLRGDIRAGDFIVVRGNEILKSGQSVKIISN